MDQNVLKKFSSESNLWILWNYILIYSVNKREKMNVYMLYPAPCGSAVSKQLSQAEFICDVETKKMSQAFL